MATTIENFLIGIGLQYDKQGERNALSAISSVKSKALQLAAVMGAGFGFKALTLDAAQGAASLSRFSTAIGVSQKGITAFGSAIQQEGGSMEESISLLQTFTKLQDDLQKELRPELFGDLSRIGADPGMLLMVKNAENAERAIAAVVKSIEGLSPETQRKALQVIGADSQALLLTAQKGIENYENVVSDAVKRLQTDANFGKQSEQFTVEFLKFGEALDSISREISADLIPPLTEVIGAMSQWVAVNREFISSGIESTTKFVAENFKEIGIALGVIGGAAAFKTLKGVASIPGKLGGLGSGGGGKCCPGDSVGTPDGKSGKGKGGMGKLGKVLGGALLVGLITDKVLDITDNLSDLFTLTTKGADELEKEKGYKKFEDTPIGGLLSATPFEPPQLKPERQFQKDLQSFSPPPAQAQAQRPIQIENILMLDGEVLARSAVNAMEFNNHKTLSELQTSIGG